MISKSKLIGPSVFLLVLMAYLAGGEAYASEIWVHGNSGNERLEYSEFTPQGLKVCWDYSPKSGSIYYSIPFKPDSVEKATGVLINYTLINGADSRITKVHVYNGSTKVKTFSGPWATVGKRLLKFKLNPAISFTRGLGIVIDLEFGTGGSEDAFIFHGVGYEYIDH